MGALGLIAQYPDSSGYDLLKMFNESLANVWPATQSQLYNELNRLDADGLVEISSRGARGRKNYRITEDGRGELRAWLTSSDPEPFRNPMLLRVFLLSEVSRSEADGILDRVEATSRAWRDRLDAVAEDVPWDDTDADLYARIALEYGRRSLTAQIEWLDWAHREIGAGTDQATRDNRR
ncbi:transcriptional regulator, PadR family [Williamsia sterculiae]|uniref:Transcriptional regulator, PadR family n=2 Tax=Williamsia sterculiae TaxID=1344003 RepID=A0A1N7FFH2_9NOCA|nr:transcriptional regulator, PadR family [Williamsia sterculiae]